MPKIIKQQCGCRVFQNPKTGAVSPCDCEIWRETQTPESALKNIAAWCRVRGGEAPARAIERFLSEREKREGLSWKQARDNLMAAIWVTAVSELALEAARSASVGADFARDHAWRLTPIGGVTPNNGGLVFK